ncbi:MAG: TRAP transporter TatT component family protein [Desulfobacula sp.]|nr:TRAP transporter TatT component family protein [Desulfobacula sp.]
MNHRTLNAPVSRILKTVAVYISFVLTLAVLSGCSMLMSSATSDIMSHLSKSILNNDDLGLVEQGAPAYLLMIDSLISKDPDNKKMLSTAAMLYSAYADVFVEDTGRAKKMSAKALRYAKKALCLSQKKACNLQAMKFEDFEKALSALKKDDLDPLFSLGNAWGGWIMANKSDYNAIADLSRIEAIMLRIVELDETFKEGAPFLYLGSLSSFFPPALGGRPQEGKKYFDKAIQLSKGKDLMVKVVYAEIYARNIFDRKLHDTLLNEVIAADPYVDGHTLINTWAKKKAQKLLNNADEYF